MRIAIASPAALLLASSMNLRGQVWEMDYTGKPGVKQGTGNYGHNAATGEYGDMVAMGILEPTKVTRTALQNAAFGELALLDNAPRSAQARATQDCVLASLSRSDFESLFDAQWWSP